jgi:hypothetical protein
MSLIAKDAAPNPVVTIDGTTLGVQFSYYPTPTSSVTVVPIAAIAAAIPGVSIPPALLPFLQVPLSQVLNDIWSVNTDSSGQTLRDRTTAAVTSTINANLPSGASASALDLQTTGTLQAAVAGAGSTIYLSYQLLGNSVAVKLDETVSFIFFSETIELDWTLTFDLELLIVLNIPSGAGPIPVTAQLQVENASLTPTNDVAKAANAFLSFLDALTLGNVNVIGSAENTIDSQGGPAPDLGELTPAIAELSVIWIGALQYGFTTLVGLIQGNQLILQFEHPIDPAPVVYGLVNGEPIGVPNFLRPSLSLSAFQVDVGQNLGVTGKNFPVPTSLSIGWTDTTSGTVRESLITWFQGPSPPVLNPPVPTTANTQIIPRLGASDGRNQYTAYGLAQNATYYFQVADVDLAQTPYSALAPFTTGSGSDIIDIYIQPQAGGAQQFIGTGTLTSSTSFSATVLIPPETPGQYNIIAVPASGPSAKATVQVNAAGTGPLPIIQADGPYVTVGSLFDVSFDSFPAGTVTLYIDAPTPSSNVIGTTISLGPTQFGPVTFTWPNTVAAAGQHSLYGQGVSGPPSAPVSIYAEFPPP